jgi:acyl carrier protein
MYAQSLVAPSIGVPDRLAGPIATQVITVIQEHFGFTYCEVTEARNFTEDLGLDSLDLMSAMVDLEELFDVELPDDAAARLTTVADVVSYLMDASQINVALPR